METTTLFASGKAQLTAQQKWQHVILLFVLGYEGLCAVFGGALLIAAPDGGLLGMPVSVMNGAFGDFLIPGIALMVLGILGVSSFILILQRSPWDWIIAGLALGGFVIWFVVEIITLKELNWLHLVTGVPVLFGWLVLTPLIAMRNSPDMMQKGLLICGILSSLWYVVINIFVPTQYEGYSAASFTVSELSAIGAPTRLLWVLLVLWYPLLFGAFGWGVSYSANNNRSLRIVGGLIIAYCALNFYWPAMHMRGIEPTLTDTLHIVWASVTVLLMMIMMGFGAAAFGKSFRIYTIASIALHVLFGMLTGLEAPNIPINGPTPWIGVWERINIGIFMLWVIVFALTLLKEHTSVDEINTSTKAV